MKASLHALRDRISVGEATQLGAQLPALLRGYYFGGWRPTAKAFKDRSRSAFLSHVAAELVPDTTLDAEDVTRAVFRVLWRRISPGEIADILRTLPEEIRDLWPVR